MSEPVNLFDLDADRYPVGRHIIAALAALRQTFETTWPALELLARHVGETEHGYAHDGTAITDEELAFHQLALQQVEATLDELAKKQASVNAMAERRMWAVLTNRHSMGMVCFGKTFTAEGDLIPKMPKTDTPEHLELMAWLKEHGYGDQIKPEHVGFQAMQRIVDDLASQKQPRPPHVDLSAATGIKISR